MIGAKTVKEKCTNSPLKVIKGQGYNINIYTIERMNVYFGVKMLQTGREHAHRRQLKSDKNGLYFIYGSKVYIQTM